MGDKGNDLAQQHKELAEKEKADFTREVLEAGIPVAVQSSQETNIPELLAEVESGEVISKKSGNTYTKTKGDAEIKKKPPPKKRKGGRRTRKKRKGGRKRKCCKCKRCTKKCPCKRKSKCLKRCKCMKRKTKRKYKKRNQRGCNRKK